MPEPRTPRLTPTSYSVLGLVVAEPGSAYDLAKRMRINLEYFWPAARSHLHTEVKKLADLGLVLGTEHATGQRRRIVYRATPAGRRALKRWIAEPPTTFRLEMDGLVRLYLAGLGTADDLRQTIQTFADEAVKMHEIADHVIPGYLDGSEVETGIDQVHLRALLIDFLTSFAVFVDDWAQRSAATVEGWNDLAADRKTRPALAQLRRIQAARHERAG